MSERKRIDVRKLRRKLGVNQSAFWGRLGVTQATASRYESGRSRIPKPLRILLGAVYLSEPLP